MVCAESGENDDCDLDLVLDGLERACDFGDQVRRSWFDGRETRDDMRVALSFLFYVRKKTLMMIGRVIAGNFYEIVSCRSVELMRNIR